MRADSSHAFPRRLAAGVRAALAAAAIWGLFELTTAQADAEPSAAAFKLIAHPESRYGHLTKQFVADAFLKRITRWHDGSELVPVDQPLDSPVRRAFSRAVLDRPPEAIRSYWQQRIFGGWGVPPPELESDAAVLRYVLEHRGAMGYVSAALDTGPARVIEIRN